MVEVMEVFEDFADNAKKTFKNKKFLIAAGLVGAAGLAAYYFRSKSAESETTAYGAVGYAGYPSVSGGSVDTTSEYDSATIEQFYSDLKANNSYYDSIISEYDNTFDSLYSNVETLSNQLISTQELADQQKYQLEKQNAISQMKANSELYNALSGGAYADTRAALHAENLAIAEQYGLVFDSATGNYFDGESVAYTTSTQQAQAYSGKTANSGNVTYDNNVDYQAAINKAIMNGASATTINNLNAQRDAKIAATGYNPVSYDANTDYAALIQKAKATGADSSVISNLEAQRAAKMADMNKTTSTTKTTTTTKAASTTNSNPIVTTNSSLADEVKEAVQNRTVAMNK